MKWALAIFAVIVLYAASASAITLVADPNATSGSNYYLSLVDELQPGDSLVLPAGTYRNRLNLSGLRGEPGAWITITGPESGSPAVITTDSNCCNTVKLGDNAYIAIKHLTIDSNSIAVGESIDGINIKDGVSHDMIIESCTLIGQDFHQQTVGIATRSACWNITIRGNRIMGAGTGMYLGNSDGNAPFIAGVIDNNLIVDTIGYNIEIKYQNPYSLLQDMPPGPHRTIIKHNVFIKRRPQSDFPGRTSGARPNLLVGGFPDTGTGRDDMYEIYGNFFFRNPDESLLQASGRVAIHDNIFIDPSHTAVSLQNHDRPLKLAHVYNNTIYGGMRGIRFGSAAQQEDAVVGNMVFAQEPIGGHLTAANRIGNIEESTANAADYLQSPSTVPGQMDFYPLPAMALGAPLDLSAFSAQENFDRDFNNDTKGGLTYRGAYAGEGINPGWKLDAALKTIDVSGTIPSAPAALQVQ